MSHPCEDAAGRSGRPLLRAISPEATPSEVAAIVAAVAATTAVGGVDPDGEGAGGLREWVRGARLGARRSGLQRGPWRLSGRIGRRIRA